jgi:hypothetical protein
MKISATVLLAIVSALSAQGDTLSDLRAVLGRLNGHAPIRATYEIQRSGQSKGRFVNDRYSGSVAVEIEADTAALRVVFPQALLDTIAREQAAKLRNSATDTPTLNALWEVSAVHTAEAVDFAPALLQMIDGAKLVDDRAATLQGRPARMIVLDLPQRVTQPNGTIDIGKVTVEKDRMTLWLGADGLPQVAEHVRTIKASVLLFKALSEETESWQFAAGAGRLLRLRYESKSSGSGLGQTGSGTLVFTLKPHS